MTQFNEVGPASELEKPKKCPCKCKAIVAAILIVLIASVICCHVHRPKSITSEVEMGLKPGTQCVIHFRQDAFSRRDGTTSLPTIPANGTPPMTTAFTGTVIAVDREAILFDAVYVNITFNGVPKTERLWIPKSNILLIIFQDHADL